MVACVIKLLHPMRFVIRRHQGLLCFWWLWYFLYGVCTRVLLKGGPTFLLCDSMGRQQVLFIYGDIRGLLDLCSKAAWIAASSATQARRMTAKVTQYTSRSGPLVTGRVGTQMFPELLRFCTRSRFPTVPGSSDKTEEIPPGGQLVKEESFFFFSQLEAHTIQGTPRTLP